MRAISYLTALIVVLVVQGGQTSNAAAQNRSAPHHWGQKDQEIPNNGWSNYAYLKMKQENADSFLVFKQSQDELSAELYISNNKRMHAVSIPGAGIFYQGDMATTCMPDYIEAPGIDLETTLFILSRAFPGGPEKVNRKMSAKVSGKVVREIRFMQAYAQFPPGWSAEVTIETEAVSQYVISIVMNQQYSNRLIVNWKGEGGEVVSSNEPLKNWLTCWYGDTIKEGEGYRHIPYVEDAETLQTFGQLRSKLNSP